MTSKENQIGGIGLFLTSIGGLIIGYSLLKDINSAANMFFAGIFIIVGIILVFKTRMTRKKLFYTLGIIVVIVILIEGVFLMIDGRLWLPIRGYNTDDVIRPITVFQSGGSNQLVAECGDKNYIGNKSDYIIEGTVKDVWSDWVDMKTGIHTYTDLAIENYVKGTPLTENTGNLLTIITPGGCVGDTCQAVEDQPIFHEGKKVRIYLRETNGEFSIVCAQMGVKEIEGIDLNDKFLDTSPSTPFFPVANTPSEFSMTALLKGELVLEDGCLRVKSKSDGYLFSLDLNYKQYLKTGEIDKQLRKALERIYISSSAKISKINEKKWEITDRGHPYIIEETDKKLNIYDGGKYLMIWPYGFSLSRDESGVIHVIDDNGKPIARVGDKVKMGGGETSKEYNADIRYISGISAQLPSDRCSGPYWIVGEVITNLTKEK